MYQNKNKYELIQKFTIYVIFLTVPNMRYILKLDNYVRKDEKILLTTLLKNYKIGLQQRKLMFFSRKQGREW